MIRKLMIGLTASVVVNLVVLESYFLGIATNFTHDQLLGLFLYIVFMGMFCMAYWEMRNTDDY